MNVEGSGMCVSIVPVYCPESFQQQDTEENQEEPDSLSPTKGPSSECSRPRPWESTDQIGQRGSERELRNGKGPLWRSQLNTDEHTSEETARSLQEPPEKIRNVASWNTHLAQNSAGSHQPAWRTHEEKKKLSLVDVTEVFPELCSLIFSIKVMPLEKLLEATK